MERLSGEKLLSGLAFERDSVCAACAVLGHGFAPQFVPAYSQMGTQSAVGSNPFACPGWARPNATLRAVEVRDYNETCDV